MDPLAETASLGGTAFSSGVFIIRSIILGVISVVVVVVVVVIIIPRDDHRRDEPPSRILQITTTIATVTVETRLQFALHGVGTV